jgi:hypothetical protein
VGDVDDEEEEVTLVALVDVPELLTEVLAEEDEDGDEDEDEDEEDELTVVEVADIAL